MKVLIGADLVPTEQSEALFISGDTAALFGGITALAKEYDRFVVNLECALTVGDEKITKCGPNIKADPRCAKTLVKAGITDICLANNHVYDFGQRGLIDTMAALDEAGLPYTGVGANDVDSRKIYYVTVKGETLAIVNVCEHEYSYALPDRMGCNPYDPYLSMHDVRAAKAHADYVLVVYHGGKEHCRYPSPRLRSLCREMAECGANAVVCQHSHCIGCYEFYEGCHIMYGQGNFHFAGIADNEMWNTAMLMGIEFGVESKITFYPIARDGARVDLCAGETKERLLSELAGRNRELADGSWAARWHEFCEKMKGNYLGGIAAGFAPDATDRQKQTLRHYIDCEAHSDVLHEILPTWHKTE